MDNQLIKWPFNVVHLLRSFSLDEKWVVFDQWNSYPNCQQLSCPKKCCCPNWRWPRVSKFSGWASPNGPAGWPPHNPWFSSPENFSFEFWKFSGCRHSGFVCAYHPAGPGSSPKHTINYIVIYNQICTIFVMWKERKWTKRGRVWPIFYDLYYWSRHFLLHIQSITWWQINLLWWNILGKLLFS